MGKEEITELIQSVGLDARVRGERLSLAEYAALSNAAEGRLKGR